MLYEGIKETENTRIEKDEETKDEIEMLYSFGVILFEHTILESDELMYSICYFEPKKVYDLVIQNKNNGKLISYEVKTKLNNQEKNYFNLTKNEETTDQNNNKLICMSHSVEYTL